MRQCAENHTPCAMFLIILRPGKCATRQRATTQQYFFLVLDHFKTQELCIKAIEIDPWQLKDVLDHFKTQEMYDDAVWRDAFSLQYVPDYFMTQQLIEL